MIQDVRKNVRETLLGRDTADGSILAVGASGTQVDVAAGDALVGTDGNGDPVRVSTSATTVTLPNADSENPRKDTIFIDDTGTVDYQQGVAEPAAPSGNARFDTFSPEPPLPSGVTVLAEVWVGAGATTLSSADVRDRRQPAQIVGEEIAAETLRAATLGRNVDAQGNNITGIGTAEADSLSTGEQTTTSSFIFGSEIKEITSGSVEATSPFVRLTGEGDAADELTDITNPTPGQRVVLAKNAVGYDITIKDTAGSGETQIVLSGSDFVLSNRNDKIELIYTPDGNNWTELSRSAN